jgi:hypothetical protein
VKHIASGDMHMLALDTAGVRYRIHAFLLLLSFDSHRMFILGGTARKASADTVAHYIFARLGTYGLQRDFREGLSMPTWMNSKRLHTQADRVFSGCARDVSDLWGHV